METELFFATENVFQGNGFPKEEMNKHAKEFFDKTNGITITLPFVPNKEMILDLTSYKEDFNFSDEYCSFLDDCGVNWFAICGIYITKRGLRIWLINTPEALNSVNEKYPAW